MIMYPPSYYKTIATIYDTIVPRDITGICYSVEKIIQRYNKNKEMLDLGCGTGRFTIELAKRGYRVIGLDLTDEMLEVARSSARKANVKVKFMRGDIRNFKLKKRIDTIWVRGCIGDLTNINDVKKAFKNIRSNLLKNGIFIFDVRDFSYYMKKFKDGFRSENRIFKERNKVTNFSFSARLNKNTKIEKMKGEIVVKTGKSIKKYSVYHILRYYTHKGITDLLGNAGFNVLEIQQRGYKLDKKKKPQFVIVAQK